MDTTLVALTAISAVVTISLAYIAARYSISRRNKKEEERK